MYLVRQMVFHSVLHVLVRLVLTLLLIQFVLVRAVVNANLNLVCLNRQLKNDN